MAFANTLLLKEKLKNDKKVGWCYVLYRNSSYCDSEFMQSCSHSFLKLTSSYNDVVNGILETLQNLHTGEGLGLLNGMHLQKNMERNFRYFQPELT